MSESTPPPQQQKQQQQAPPPQQETKVPPLPTEDELKRHQDELKQMQQQQQQQQTPPQQQPQQMEEDDPVKKVEDTVNAFNQLVAPKPMDATPTPSTKEPPVTGQKRSREEADFTAQLAEERKARESMQKQYEQMRNTSLQFAAHLVNQQMEGRSDAEKKQALQSLQTSLISNPAAIKGLLEGNLAYMQQQKKEKQQLQAFLNTIRAKEELRKQRQSSTPYASDMANLWTASQGRAMVNASDPQTQPLGSSVGISPDLAASLLSKRDTRAVFIHPDTGKVVTKRS